MTPTSEIPHTELQGADGTDRPSPLRPPIAWRAVWLFAAIWVVVSQVSEWLGAPEWLAVGFAVTLAGLLFWPLGLSHKVIPTPLDSGLERLAARRGWTEWTFERWLLLWSGGGVMLALVVLAMEVLWDLLGVR